MIELPTVDGKVLVPEKSSVKLPIPTSSYDTMHTSFKVQLVKALSNLHRHLMVELPKQTCCYILDQIVCLAIKRISNGGSYLTISSLSYLDLSCSFAMEHSTTSGPVPSRSDHNLQLTDSSLVVTSHSLGHAVTSLISFSPRFYPAIGDFNRGIQ